MEINTIPKDIDQEKAPIGLVVLLLYKSISGSLEIISGIFLLVLQPLGLYRPIILFIKNTLTKKLIEDPQDRLLRWILTHHFNISPKLILDTAIILLFIGVVKIIIAIGIYKHSLLIRNSGLVILSIGAIFALYRLFIHFDFLKLIFIIIDLVIVYYVWKVLPKEYDFE